MKMEWLLCYIVFINIMGMILMGVDKIKAKTRFWRIPENTLIMVALVGGAMGIYAGLKLFHHKTTHIKFNFMVPLILLLQLILVMWAFYKN